MKRMKLVMVGNGMAGVRTLEELLKLAPDLYEITVFGSEPYANYNRILLSPVLAGEQTIQDIMLNDVDWYEKNGITLHLNKKITRIDRKNRTIGVSVKAKDVEDERAAVKEHRRQESERVSPTTLGDLIKAQMDQDRS